MDLLLPTYQSENFCSQFFRLKNKTALIPSFILLLMSGKWLARATLATIEAMKIYDSFCMFYDNIIEKKEVRFP